MIIISTKGSDTVYSQTAVLFQLAHFCLQFWRQQCVTQRKKKQQLNLSVWCQHNLHELSKTFTSHLHTSGSVTSQCILVALSKLPPQVFKEVSWFGRPAAQVRAAHRLVTASTQEPCSKKHAGFSMDIRTTACYKLSLHKLS